MLSFFQKNIPIGIDISDYSIEVLQINRKKEVLAHARILLKEDIVRDGEILKKEELATSLREVLRNTKPRPLVSKRKNLKAVLSLPESKIFLHYFEIPGDISDEELDKHVLKEASGIIPLDPKEIYWDYLIKSEPVSLGAKNSDGGKQKTDRIVSKKLKIIYTGAPKKLVHSYLEVLAMADIEPVVLDAEAFSLARSLLNSSPLNIGGSSMILDIGARMTNISIFDKNYFLNLAVNLPFAGQDFTKTLSKELGVSNQEAENLKKSFALDEKQTNKKVMSILEKSLGKIISETLKTIEYYEDRFGIPVSSIFLVGGSALLPKADHYLSLRLGRKVVIGNPLAKIHSAGSLKRINSLHPIFFANVVGLALRAAGETDEGINLFPARVLARRLKYGPERKILRSISSLIMFLKGGLVLALAFMIASVLFFFFALYYFAIKHSIKTFNPYPIKSISREIPVGGIIKGSELSTTTELLKEKQDDIIKDTGQEIIKIRITDTPTGWLNVREGPGTGYSKIDRIYPNEVYEVIDEETSWFKIKISDQVQGWVSGQYANKIKPE